MGAKQLEAGGSRSDHFDSYDIRQFREPTDVNSRVHWSWLVQRYAAAAAITWTIYATVMLFITWISVYKLGKEMQTEKEQLVETTVGHMQEMHWRQVLEYADNPAQLQRDAEIIREKVRQ
jgi:hypothetical protein